MSFQTLPPELQELIIIDAGNETLVSLCLTSIPTLFLARPLLYRRLCISIVAAEVLQSPPTEVWTDETFDQSENWDNRWRQAALARTLEAHPAWYSYVQEARLVLQAPISVGGSCAARMFKMFKNLRDLEVISETEAGPDSRTRTFLIENSPRSVISLDLSLSKLPSFAVRNLLENLPLLQSLSLGDKVALKLCLPPPTASRSPLTLLSTLSLSNINEEPSAFDILASAAPVLTSLEVDFLCLGGPVSAALPSVQDLMIGGSLSNVVDLSRGSTQRAVDWITSLLDACTSLRSFTLSNTDSRVPFQHPGHQILQHFPPLLQDLELDWPYFAKVTHLEFLVSQPNALRTLTILRLVTWDEAEEVVQMDFAGSNALEQACRERNISLEWIEWDAA
ncbi:hypothetical protein JCM16303_007167 [Sporobolomyces ruberrimus]